MVQVVCRILEALLTPENCPPGSEKEVRTPTANLNSQHSQPSLCTPSSHTLLLTPARTPV